MELQEQLERIEQLKTDRNIQVILAGAKTIKSMIDSCGPLVNNHLSKKNKTINDKLYEFSGDVSDTLDSVSDSYFQEAEKAVRAFCGFDEKYFYGESIYYYIFEEIDMDEFVESLKDAAVSINEYKMDVQKGFIPGLDERIRAIEQLKTDKEVLNLIDKINTDDNEPDFSAVIRLSELIAEKVWLPDFELFEEVQYRQYENSIKKVVSDLISVEKMISDLIEETKNYINGGYFREEDEA